jgi:hypothetical protein
MRSHHGDGAIDSFTLELLRTGYMLINLASEIAEPTKGEDVSGQEAVEMISGTIRTYLDEVNEDDVRRATELIGGAVESVTEHLELALALRKRMNGCGEGRLFDEPPPDEDGDPVDPRSAEFYPFPVYRPEIPDVLDELTMELIDCGGVLSQLIGGMIAHDAAGRSAQDADPIPEVAHRFIREVMGDLRKRHSKRDVAVAARIVHEARERICNDIFFVNADYVDPEMN